MGIDLARLGFQLANSQGTEEIRGVIRYPVPTPYLNSTNSSRLYKKSGYAWDRSRELRVLGSLEEQGRFGGWNGRSLVCRCYAGQCLSVTLRKSGKAGSESYRPQFDYARLEARTCKYRPSRSREEFLFSLDDTCRALYFFLHTTPPGQEIPAGVYVIAGGTGSGKSQIVRGLIWYFLRDRVKYLSKRLATNSEKPDKRPHLLTLENPIEEYLFEEASKNPGAVQAECDIDYTPRQLLVDTPNLEQALMKDALRQTPYLVYVGEIRHPAELRTVLDFAETGHAVITTLHAGSVRESLQRLLNAADAHTAATQGQIAQRIRAIIQLEQIGVEAQVVNPSLNGVSSKKLALPALWRGTPAGVAALVADGPSSVLPVNPYPSLIDARNSYSIGRAFFLDMMLDSFPSRINNKDELKVAAIAKDLQSGTQEGH